MFTKLDIEKYFVAEKQESLVFLVLGIVAIAMALVFYFVQKTPGFRGAAYPLLILGLIQSAAGYAVFNRSDDQRINGVYAYDMNPDQLKKVELPRMKKVSLRFKIYRKIEIAAIVCGLILVFVFRNSSVSRFWFGFGISITLMAAELFIADYIAEKRAIHYTGLLEQFSRPDPGSAPRPG